MHSNQTQSKNPLNRTPVHSTIAIGGRCSHVGKDCMRRTELPTVAATIHNRYANCQKSAHLLVNAFSP